jgi:hypothetical protein
MLTEIMPTVGFGEPQLQDVPSERLTFESVLKDKINNVDSWRNYADQMYGDLLNQAYSRSEALSDLREKYKDSKDLNPEEKTEKYLKSAFTVFVPELPPQIMEKRSFPRSKKKPTLLKKR